jgi:hypothetical protein
LQGRINFTTLANLPEGAPVMSGTFFIHNKPAIILFDSGALNSFISAKFCAKVVLDFYYTKGSYMILTPSGKTASNQIISHVSIKMGSKIIKTNLILWALEGMDIILGMNWMVLHGVTLDISSRAVEINSPSHEAATLYLPSWECINFCAFTIEGAKPKDILVVCEFTDAFLDDLPRMPPDRDIEFIIKL